MAANPEPRYCVTIENSDSTITKSYSYRPYIFNGVDTFEMQGGVKWILFPEPEGFSGALFDVFR